jgi:hypothetical protein
MLQIIGGKRYNTETATKVATYHNNLGRSDFHCVEETLYLTPKGAWFLQYWGGALTHYSRSCGNSGYCGDSGLKPLDTREAYQWLEDNEKTEALEKYFAEQISEA